METSVIIGIAIALVLLTVLVMMNLKRSKHGRAIMAIRDNRIAAESVGLNVTYYKLAVFIIAAFFAGAAGTLYGHFYSNVKAASFDYNMSIEILVIVVLGGVHPDGGKGGILGVTLSIFLMQMVSNAFTLMHISQDVKNFANGLLLIIALVAVIIIRKASEKQKKV